MAKVTTFLIVQAKISHVLTYAEMTEAFVAPFHAQDTMSGNNPGVDKIVTTRTVFSDGETFK